MYELLLLSSFVPDESVHHRLDQHQQRDIHVAHALRDGSGRQHHQNSRDECHQPAAVDEPLGVGGRQQKWILVGKVDRHKAVYSYGEQAVQRCGHKPVSDERAEEPRNATGGQQIVNENWLVNAA